jgi:ADP-ribosylglycohydrolase
VKLETYITHANTVSYEVSLAVNLLCRELIKGKGWKESLNTAQSQLKEPLVISAIENSATCDDTSKLSRDGFAPEVLKAALYFIHKTNNFSDALTKSIIFAGGANYCPVLVGALAGALYGADAVLKNPKFNMQDNSLLNEALSKRIQDVANGLASSWE